MSSSNSASERRVVITGLGLVTPLGIGIDPFWENLQAGKSGVSTIKLFAESSLPHHIGAEVPDFNEKVAKEYLRKEQKKSLRLMCREIQLGVVSAMIALDHAGIAQGQLDPERLGVEFGANLMLSPPSVLADACFSCSANEAHEFKHDLWGTLGLSNMQPLWLLQYLPNMPACHIGISADARGPNNSLTMAEASGNMVLGEALRIIARGSADVMITGTTGTTLHPVKSLHAVLWDVLADDAENPARACKPFDLNRSGQVVGEGAATMILEEESHAKARGATIYGTILGAGTSCVLDKTGTPDFRRALVLAMRDALEDAQLTPADIGHINAHGLATPEIDPIEALAIHDVFGDQATSVPVTAFKSYFGNPGSSCGTLEAAASVVGLAHGVILPTLNYETPDPACRLNVVAGSPQTTSNKVFLSLNFTRQGQASAVIIRGT